jgi:hypothetical protein
MEEEIQTLTDVPEETWMSLESMEQRLQMQSLDGCLADAALCVWFACTDVCPPGG